MLRLQRRLITLRPTTSSANLKSGQAMNVIKSVLPYLWPKSRKDIQFRVVLAMLALVLGEILGLLAPYFYGVSVDALAPGADEDQTIFMLTAGALGMVVAYGVMRILSVGFSQLRDVIFAQVGQRALRQLALETFRHMHRLSLRYHITRKTGGLSRVMERGVKGVEFLLRFMLFSIGPLILKLLIVAGIFYLEFGFIYMAIVLITIVLYIWFTFSVTEWRVKVRKEMNDKDTDANQKAIDSLLNFETVKYFGAEEREALRYDESMRGYEAAALKTSYSLAFLNFGQTLLITGGLITVMILAAMAVQRGELSVGDFVMANAYMIQITMPLGFLGTVYREIRQALVDMGEMFDLLGQPQEVIDVANAEDLNIKGGQIEFDNVTFGYDPERTILSKLSLKIKKGETVAIVGPSGSGKSTIGRLLFRFYDVNSGSLKIDGQDIRNVTQASVHNSIGIVPQDTVLFNDTIGYNIAYGRDGASEDEIIAAAKSAKIHDFIISLTDGYNTTVGERGLKLSGGEKQRVGIARTLLKNPPILVLDEATSALDTETERNIQDSLRGLGSGRSVITIAHRLSTVVDADQIIVLEQGCIVEKGTHDELLNLNGRYTKMWHIQESEAELAV
ncbi:ABC transporter, fused ATPase and inner membrane subunits [alpha proteobacterium HTCC2255]|jgi:ATP-binding cassette subfamily B protein|nr:ABC transporter, fused ATPase and inner membrane subunits [alpha proteobacterium HTCC2255] [Rhodobacterales bacterium HTCC2255]